MAKRKLSIGSPSSGKKPRQEIPLSPAKITEPAKRTDVEGIIRCVSESPHRKGESPLHTFFDGELSDGEQIVRMMGYDKSQLNKLQKFCVNQEPCLLKHCMISERKNEKLQVVIKSYTSIEKSKPEFDIPDSANDGSTTTTLGSLSVFSHALFLDTDCLTLATCSHFSFTVSHALFLAFDCLSLALRTPLCFSLSLALALAIHCLFLALCTLVFSSVSLVLLCLTALFMLILSLFSNTWPHCVHEVRLQCSTEEHWG